MPNTRQSPIDYDMSDGAMAAFAPWATLCTHHVIPFPKLSSTSIFTLNQHTVSCVGGSLAPAQLLMKKKRKKAKEDSSFAHEHVLQLARDHHEGELVPVDDEGAEDETNRMRNEQIRRAELKEKLSQILSNAQRLKIGYSKHPCYSLGDHHEGELVPVDDDVAEDERNRMRNEQIRRAELKEKLSQILSNAQRLKIGYSNYPCYSLGIDFGDARTGVAISKGFAPRPIEVVELQGQKLEARLIEIAHKEGAIEFVVGLPMSDRGMETSQSNKTRCFAGRLAVLAAQRGWRVYLHDEFGTSNDALEYMIMMGSTKKTRKTRLDAYAAVVLLQAYFNSSGEHAELVVPKKLPLQERLCEAPIVPESDDDDIDFEDEQL